MTRVSTDGAAHTSYGPRNLETQLPTQYDQHGGYKTLEYLFDFDTLPTTSATDIANLTIPANSYIEEARLQVITAFAGGTSYDFGTAETDGSVIDVNGLDEAVALSLMNAVGETVVMDGDQIQATAGIGTAAAQVTVTATGTYTAGRARLIIKYRTLSDRG